MDLYRIKYQGAKLLSVNNKKKKKVELIGRFLKMIYDLQTLIHKTSCI